MAADGREFLPIAQLHMAQEADDMLATMRQMMAVSEGLVLHAHRAYTAAEK